jgi:hypothetical protein
MEKKGVPTERTYTSEKILGQMYDMVEIKKFTPLYELPFDDRVLKAYDLSDETLRKAADIKDEYDSAIWRIQAQHAISTEFEVVSTFVLSHNNEKREWTFAEELGHIISMLKSQFRKICAEAAGGKEFHNLGPFVAAMYTVTAREVQKALEECKRTRKLKSGREVPVRKMEPKSMPLISFPWIFDRELGKIANGGFELRGNMKAPQGAHKKSKTTGGAVAAAAATVVETAAGAVRQDEDLLLFEDSDKPKTKDILNANENGNSNDGEKKGRADYDEETAALNKKGDEHAAMVESGIQGPREFNYNLRNQRRRQLFDPKASKVTEWAPGKKVELPTEDEDGDFELLDPDDPELVREAMADTEPQGPMSADPTPARVDNGGLGVKAGGYSNCGWGEEFDDPDGGEEIKLDMDEDTAVDRLKKLIDGGRYSAV